MTPLRFALWIVAGFLVGSIPFGVLVSRAFFGTDLRAHGSGNIGAANALRALGKGPALAVLILDALKGALPAAAAAGYGGDALPWLAPATGAAAVLGHIFSPWLGWRGGKGVATSLGVVFALAWPAGLAFVVVWAAAAAATGYSSAGSLAASFVTPFALWLWAGPPAAAYGVFAAVVIVVAHRANIARLRAGTEHPLQLFRKRPAPP